MAHAHRRSPPQAPWTAPGLWPLDSAAPLASSRWAAGQLGVGAGQLGSWANGELGNWGAGRGSWVGSLQGNRPASACQLATRSMALVGISGREKVPCMMEGHLCLVCVRVKPCRSSIVPGTTALMAVSVATTSPCSSELQGRGMCSGDFDTAARPVLPMPRVT